MPRKRTTFEQIAVPHLAGVYRFACQFTAKERAQDLVQETYLRAWKYFDSFRTDTNCRSWLYRILHNVWRDAAHRQRLEIPLIDDEAAGIEPYYDWEEEFWRDELSENLAAALSQLPEVYRWAVLLADVEELSYQEIATVMDCPIGTVMSRVNRGRRTLASLLLTSRINPANELDEVIGKISKE